MRIPTFILASLFAFCIVSSYVPALGQVTPGPTPQENEVESIFLPAETLLKAVSSHFLPGETHLRTLAPGLWIESAPDMNWHSAVADTATEGDASLHTRPLLLWKLLYLSQPAKDIPAFHPKQIRWLESGKYYQHLEIILPENAEDTVDSKVGSLTITTWIQGKDWVIDNDSGEKHPSLDSAKIIGPTRLCLHEFIFNDMTFKSVVFNQAGDLVYFVLMLPDESGNFTAYISGEFMPRDVRHRMYRIEIQNSAGVVVGRKWYDSHVSEIK